MQLLKHLLTGLVEVEVSLQMMLSISASLYEEDALKFNSNIAQLRSERYITGRERCRTCQRVVHL